MKTLETILKDLEQGKISADMAEMQILDNFNVFVKQKPECGNPNPPCSPNLKHGMLECTGCQWGE